MCGADAWTRHPPRAAHGSYNGRDVIAALAAAFVIAAGPPNDGGPLPTIAAPSTVSRIEARLSTAAARIAGKPVEVRCWNAADWVRLDEEWRAWAAYSTLRALGYASVKTGRVHLAPRACAALVPFLYRKHRPKNGTAAKKELARALVTLGHEAQHVAGVKDERTAECYGQQRVRPLARLLGATKDYAAGLAVHAWRYTYTGLPTSYKSPECRNGGTLDLNPRAVAWP